MIERRLLIDDPAEQERLWEFYSRIFRPIDEETPISQSFPRSDFMNFMANERVRKFVATDGDEIIGLSMITDQLELEPLLSLPYFAKHFPGVPILYVMGIAVDTANRRSIFLAAKLLQLMIDEAPENGMGLFFHSEGANDLIPRLAKHSGKGGVIVDKLDSETICIVHWTSGKVQTYEAG